MPKWAWSRCSGGGGGTPSIESMPIWTWFRCSASGEVVESRRASKACPAGRFCDVRRVGKLWRHAEHRKHAQLGIVSMFGGWEVEETRRTSKACPRGYGLDVWEVETCRTSKVCPRGYLFDVRRVGGCRARRTSKTCSRGHGLDVLKVERWWRHAEHRKNAHLGIFSMFSGRKCCGDTSSNESMLRWHVFVVRRVETYWRTDDPPSRFSSEGGGSGVVEVPLRLAFRAREGIGVVRSPPRFERGRGMCRGSSWKGTPPPPSRVSSEGRGE